MSEKPPDGSDAQLKWLGILVMAVGAIVALLCGLCTLYVGAAFAGAAPSGGLKELTIPLVVGGIPTLAGIATFGVGAWMFVHGGRGKR